MVYVDTSVIVAYYCAEPLSERVEAFLTTHIRPAISGLTEAEFFSALSWKVREGGMARKAAVQISSKFLAHLQQHFYAYLPVERRHYTLAREWLGLFSTRLRTLDSLHLAFASFEGLPISTADHDLYESARYLHIEAAFLEWSQLLPFNSLIVSILRRLPKSLVRPVAMRYIAGERLEDAVRVVRALNAQKMMATLDVLGEDVSRREEAEEAVQAGERALDSISREGLNSNLSIKLTQFGIKIDAGLAYENLKRIVQRARGLKNFVRIDMEDSSLTGITLDLYRKLRGEGFENVGVVIQAYLRRSEEDVKRLIPTRANVRVVKGIYNESEAVAFKDREEIRRNYLKLLGLLLEGGCYAGIATHDDFLVENAYQSIRKMNLSPDSYEFQMLYGVRPNLRDEIVRRGHRMRIYVPFGKQWYPYSMRRFQENPQMARYVLRALFFKE